MVVVAYPTLLARSSKDQVLHRDVCYVESKASNEIIFPFYFDTKFGVWKNKVPCLKQSSALSTKQEWRTIVQNLSDHSRESAALQFCIFVRKGSI